MRGKNNHFRLKNGYFSRTQRKYIQNLRTSQGYIFLMLQPNFAILMLFPAMIVDFVLVSIKISSIDSIDYSWNHSLLIKLLIVAD